MRFTSALFWISFIYVRTHAHIHTVLLVLDASLIMFVCYFLTIHFLNKHRQSKKKNNNQGSIFLFKLLRWSLGF
jgi:hypothetical protein